MVLRIGNRPLKTLPGLLTRPTTARVREAVFNIWQGEIEDCTWLDLCAGTGAMGAEALWRGAKRVVGIERLGKACRVIEENWRSFAQPRQIIQVIQGDVVQVLTQLEGCQFDRIYFDPPYESDCYGSVLREIVQGQLLHPSGSLAVEHDPKRPMAEVLGLRLDRQKVYGNSALSLYCRNVSNFSEG